MVNPYEAFSTLQPVKNWPSSVTSEHPTRNLLYGEYECCLASIAFVDNPIQQTVIVRGDGRTDGFCETDRTA
jgi:hypothetical protein